MREFTHSISESLIKGLRPEEGNIGTSFLNDCFNAKTKTHGLVPYVEPSNPFAEGDNIVTNGVFADGTGWVLSSWTIGSGEATSSTNHASMTQGIVATKLLQGSVYRVQCDITVTGTATVAIALGGTSVTLLTSDADFYVVAGTSNLNLIFTTTIPISGTVTVDNVVVTLEPRPTSDTYPFPYYYRTSEFSLLVDTNKIYEISSGVAMPLSATDCTLATTYNAHTGASEAISLGTNNYINFISTGTNAWYIIHEGGILFKTNLASIDYIDTNIIYQASKPRANAATYFKGRIVMGGFDSANFWSDDWLALWDRWKDMLPNNVVLTEEGFDRNYVMWSDISDGFMWLIYPDVATYGWHNNIREFSTKNPWFFEMLRKGGIGWTILPFDGAVLKMKPLGTHIIVYGEDGIVAMTPIYEPVPTYKITKIADFGIPTYGDICVAKNKHIFLDFAGNLWSITPDLNLQKLGYSEYLSPTLAVTQTTPILTSYNEIDNECYIGDKTDSFVLTESGLSEIKDTITSGMYYYKSGNSGSFRSLSNIKVSIPSTDSEFRVTTERLDMDVRGIKTISGIDLGVTTNGTQTLQVALDYRFDKIRGFTTTSYFNVNKEGFVVIPVSGVEFRIRIKSDEFADINLDNIRVHWTLSDKRSTRGVYAS